MKIEVPKLSAPLVKAIRTSEGIMVWALNIGIAAFTALEPASLPHKDAMYVVAANTALHGVYRTTLKIFAVQKAVIGVEPPNQLPSGQ